LLADLGEETMMTSRIALSALAFGIVAGSSLAVRAEEPAWAYGFATQPPANFQPPAPGAPQQQDNVKKMKVEGSKLEFTRAQVSNRYGPADWFPEDHPTPPEIVAHGHQSATPTVWACSLCHLPPGKGRPENANLTGLSYDYIIQQLKDFRNGARKTSDPRKGNTATMAGFATALTDDEMIAAANFFAAVPATQWVTVKETDTVPKTRPQGGIFFKLEGADAGTEPIGNRIIETPVDDKQTEEFRNSRSGFIAYVPTGSIKKGEAIVTTGAGKVTACVACHGPDLKGLGPVPRLAGRSPSYVVRQLYDMQTGHRAGAWTPLMVPVVANLTNDDMLAAAAYIASLKP
jgi:cytochrome c553